MVQNLAQKSTDEPIYKYFIVYLISVKPVESKVDSYNHLIINEYHLIINEEYKNLWHFLTI